jgi:hypothetical protein
VQSTAVRKKRSLCPDKDRAIAENVLHSHKISISSFSFQNRSFSALDQPFALSSNFAEGLGSTRDLSLGS